MTLLSWQRAVERLPKAAFRTSLEKMQKLHVPASEVGSTSGGAPVLLTSASTIGLAGTAYLAHFWNARWSEYEAEKIEAASTEEPDFSGARYGGVFEAKAA